MRAAMLAWASRNLFFPLWEVKDGAHRQQYLRELTRTQCLDLATLQARQWEKLQALVAHAFECCPYYRRRLRAIGYDGALRDWQHFLSLPLLSKRDVREYAFELRSTRHPTAIEAKTGGSTGVALSVYFDERCQQQRNAAAMRSDRWAGWDIGTKTAAVWGNPPPIDTLRKRLRSVLLDRMIYLDTMNISEESVRHFVSRWRREKPQFLFGHAHSLYILALLLRQHGWEDVRPRGIVSTSMALLDPERVVIEDVFDCKVTNRYGCEEVGLIACECERHDGLHLNIDHLVIEFLRPDGTCAAPGEEGEIVVTDLVNQAMPMIRYRIEDIGIPLDRACECGRGLPLMQRVVGRRADFLRRGDGSLVAGVSLVERTLTAIPGIEQMQLVQDTCDAVAANIVVTPEFNIDAERSLRSELEQVFGHRVSIDIRRVASLDRTSAGKYRFAVCNIDLPIAGVTRTRETVCQ